MPFWHKYERGLGLAVTLKRATLRTNSSSYNTGLLEHKVQQYWLVMFFSMGVVVSNFHPFSGSPKHSNVIRCHPITRNNSCIYIYIDIAIYLPSYLPTSLHACRQTYIHACICMCLCVYVSLCSCWFLTGLIWPQPGVQNVPLPQASGAELVSEMPHARRPRSGKSFNFGHNFRAIWFVVQMRGKGREGERTIYLSIYLSI